MRWLWMVMIAVVGVTTSVPTHAQDDNAPGVKADKQRDRLAKVRHRMLRQKLGLSEDKAAKVEKILDDHQAKRAEVRKAMREGRQALGKLMREDSDDQAAYAAAIAKLERAQADELKVKLEQFAELKKVLTPKEQAKLLRAAVKLRQHLAGKGGKGGKRGERGERPRKPPERRPQRGRHQNPGF